MENYQARLRHRLPRVRRCSRTKKNNATNKQICSMPRHAVRIRFLLVSCVFHIRLVFALYLFCSYVASVWYLLCPTAGYAELLQHVMSKEGYLLAVQHTMCNYGHRQPCGCPTRCRHMRKDSDENRQQQIERSEALRKAEEIWDLVHV